MAEKATVLVDARNVQRSQWPNLPDEELVKRARVWAERHDAEAILVERPSLASAPHHALHDVRVERRATKRHAADGIYEQRQITHTVLEQIADAFRSLADQIEGVAVL